jgi:multiple sugar transport system permease protein
MSTANQGHIVTGSRSPTIVAYSIVALGAIAMAAPFVWMVLTSFTLEARIFSYPPAFWPDPFVMANYEQLFRDAPVVRYALNSTIIAVLTSVGVIASCSLGAFSLARLRFPGRSLWFAIILMTLFVPSQVLLIPRYFVFRSLGWIDTLLPLVVPSFFGGAFGIFLLHQFFRAIPEEIVDAARVDGANPFQVFLNVFLPLSGPALAALAIFQFLYAWNEFLEPLIYLNTDINYTFPLALTRFQNHYGGEYKWGVILAGAFLGTLPSIIVYVVGQRQFVQGIVLSGIKR